jgi:hypothetical protein
MMQCACERGVFYLAASTNKNALYIYSMIYIIHTWMLLTRLELTFTVYTYQTDF